MVIPKSYQFHLCFKQTHCPGAVCPCWHLTRRIIQEMSKSLKTFHHFSSKTSIRHYRDKQVTSLSVNQGQLVIRGKHNSLFYFPKCGFQRQETPNNMLHSILFLTYSIFVRKAKMWHVRNSKRMHWSRCNGFLLLTCTTQPNLYHFRQQILENCNGKIDLVEILLAIIL